LIDSGAVASSLHALLAREILWENQVQVTLKVDATVAGPTVRMYLKTFAVL
jgi:hypothetical protein